MHAGVHRLGRAVVGDELPVDVAMNEEAPREAPRDGLEVGRAVRDAPEQEEAMPAERVHRLADVQLAWPTPLDQARIAALEQLHRYEIPSCTSCTLRASSVTATASALAFPVLMLNGRHDYAFPVEQSQVPLFRFLGAPEKDKRHVVLDAGHAPPRQAIIKEILDWLDRYLGPASLK